MPTPKAPSKPASAHEPPNDPILRPRQIEREFNVAWKTVRRAHPDAVLKLGKRARGMRRSDVLSPPE
jgi:hypothetical protein